jgi:DNA polymerase III alpha subunit
MEETIPIFKSHYSLGRSILTLKMPKEVQEDESSDSVFDICDDAGLKEMYLVDDNMAGFLEAFTNAEALKIKLIFGLRLTFCPDSNNKSEEGRQNAYKNIIFAKNAKGYKQLIKIYTLAAQDGFYYEPRIDFKRLKPLWSNDLLLAIPFYDSFLYKNKYTNSQCVPDFSFTEPVFFSEDNDVLLDKDMQERVSDFCLDKYEIIKTKSIYYKYRKDFSAYLTFRCINGRTNVEKPNFDGMCSPEFCYESYLEAVNG